MSDLFIPTFPEIQKRTFQCWLPSRGHRAEDGKNIRAIDYREAAKEYCRQIWQYVDSFPDITVRVAHGDEWYDVDVDVVPVPEFESTAPFRKVTR